MYFWCYFIGVILENQMEVNMTHEMETGIILGRIGAILG